MLRTELEWLNRGARARSTKQKAHIQRIENLQEQRGPVRDRTVQLDSVASRLGKTTLKWKAWQVAIRVMSVFMIFPIFF